MNPDKIDKALEKAKYRTTVLEIIFLDAAKVRDVRSITNQVVATYKKLIGLYLTEEPDQIYGVTHLILEDLTEGTLDRPTVYSVPLPIIMSVRNISTKTTKTMSEVGFPILAGRGVKVYQRGHGIGAEVKPDDR